MSLNVNGNVYCAPIKGSVACQKASVARNSVAMDSCAMGSVARDSVAFKSEKTLSVPQMQNIIKKAKTTAAGWGVFFPVLSPLYFALRGKGAIAKTYGLDTKKDAALIGKIKKEQIKSSLPALLFGANYLISPITWYINKHSDPSKISLEDIQPKEAQK